MPHSQPVGPSQCALLIMDYQPAVLGLVSDGDKLMEHANCVSDTRQEVHRVLMEQVFPGQADIITTAGLHPLLEGTA
jgi:hypothetical protein